MKSKALFTAFLSLTLILVQASNNTSICKHSSIRHEFSEIHLPFIRHGIRCNAK